VAGSLIDLEVELTANHRGHFQFKICPVGKEETDATQAARECHHSKPYLTIMYFIFAQSDTAGGGGVDIFLPIAPNSWSEGEGASKNTTVHDLLTLDICYNYNLVS
jgi:hypothetical protein